MEEIPLQAVPNQSLQCILNEQECTIHVYQRGTRLYLDLWLAGEIVREGAVCLPGISIGGDIFQFSGYLIFSDNQSQPNKQKPPHYSELGTRYQLFFYTDDEYDEVLEIEEIML